MNYYNPYMGFYPYVANPAKTGLFSSLFKGGKFSLGSIISGTQKTLGFINQAIPVIKQVSPVVKNAKTMFKVMNEFKKTDTPTKTHKVEPNKINNIDTNKNMGTKSIKNNTTDEQTNNGPTFFI